MALWFYYNGKNLPNVLPQEITVASDCHYNVIFLSLPVNFIFGVFWMLSRWWPVVRCWSASVTSIERFWPCVNAHLKSLNYLCVSSYSINQHVTHVNFHPETWDHVIQSYNIKCIRTIAYQECGRSHICTRHQTIIIITIIANRIDNTWINIGNFTKRTENSTKSYSHEFYRCEIAWRINAATKLPLAPTQ